MRLEGPSSVRREARDLETLPTPEHSERLRFALSGHEQMTDFLVETFGPIPAKADVKEQSR